MAKPTVAHTMIANVIEVHRNKPMVSSLKIAELFERRHDSVLRAIRVELQEEISLRKLAESTYTNERGREYPVYWLDERQALVLMPFLGGAKAREGRADDGKKTDERHFMCENKLCNFALSGKFVALDESALANEDIELLAKVRAMNGSLIAAGLDYEHRKPMLAQYAIRERTKRIAAPAPAPQLPALEASH